MVVLWLCFCGGVVVVFLRWWCCGVFCGGVVVVFWWLCGGVVVVVFLWWSFCGVFQDCHATLACLTSSTESHACLKKIVIKPSPKVLLKSWLSLKIAIKHLPKLWWCFCCGVFVVVVVVWWCFCGGGGVVLFLWLLFLRWCFL